ncbi:MAG: hypothetical protein WCK90_00015 [archaeon]
MNRTKRGIGILGLFAFSLVLLISSVSAYSYSGFGSGNIGGFVDTAIRGMQDVATPILGAAFGQYSTTDFFFAKVLLFLLLIIVLKFALTQVPQFKKQPGVITTISVIISILSMRFISENNLTESVLLPYNTLGIVLVTLLPFLIMFWFIHKTMNHSAGRRVAWALFLLVFCILWFNRFSELSSLGNQIYGGTLVLAVLAVFMDRQISVYFSLHEIRKAERFIHDRTIISLLSELDKSEQVYASTGSQYAQDQITRIKDRLRELGVKGVR